MSHPKCLVHCRVCADYHRGRCQETTEKSKTCSYKEQKEAQQ